VVATSGAFQVQRRLGCDAEAGLGPAKGSLREKVKNEKGGG
jgi:hypothetical protein